MDMFQLVFVCSLENTFLFLQYLSTLPLVALFGSGVDGVSFAVVSMISLYLSSKVVLAASSSSIISMLVGVWIIVVSLSVAAILLSSSFSSVAILPSVLFVSSIYYNLFTISVISSPRMHTLVVTSDSVVFISAAYWLVVCDWAAVASVLSCSFVSLIFFPVDFTLFHPCSVCSNTILSSSIRWSSDENSLLGVVPFCEGAYNGTIGVTCALFCQSFIVWVLSIGLSESTGFTEIVIPGLLW